MLDYMSNGEKSSGLFPVDKKPWGVLVSFLFVLDIASFWQVQIVASYSRFRPEVPPTYLRAFLADFFPSE
jgi:hypothetical protein